MRIVVASWNANERLQKAKPGQLDFGGAWFEPSKSDKEKQRDPPEIYAVGFQESVPLPLALTGLGAAQLTRYEDEIQSAIENHAADHHKSDDEKRPSSYRLVKKHITGAIALFIYANESIADKIENVLVASLGCGILYMSNKGAVGIRFQLKDTKTSFTFVSCHLAPHNHNIARRNADWASLVSSLVFQSPSTSSTNSSSSEFQIYDTSYLFVMGDLNYRISTTQPEKLALRDIGTYLGEGDIQGLLKYDQLTQEMKAERTMHGLKEGKINFPPTYKFVKGTDRYQNFSERLPGWTDRILYAGASDVQVEHYRCIPSIRVSDHKPVKALFHIPSLSSGEHLPIRSPFPVDASRSLKQLFGLYLGRLIGSIWSILRTFGLGNAWIGAGLVLLHIAAMIAQFDYVSWTMETIKWAWRADLKTAYDEFTKNAIQRIESYLDYSSEVYLSHR